MGNGLIIFQGKAYQAYKVNAFGMSGPTITVEPQQLSKEHEVTYKGEGSFDASMPVVILFNNTYVVLLNSSSTDTTQPFTAKLITKPRLKKAQN